MQHKFLNNKPDETPCIGECDNHRNAGYVVHIQMRNPTLIIPHPDCCTRLQRATSWRGKPWKTRAMWFARLAYQQGIVIATCLGAPDLSRGWSHFSRHPCCSNVWKPNIGQVTRYISILSGKWTSCFSHLLRSPNLGKGKSLHVTCLQMWTFEISLSRECMDTCLA